MASDKAHVRYCLLHEFNKGSTTTVVYVKFMKRIQLMTANIVEGFGNSGKETEAVQIRQGVDILY